MTKIFDWTDLEGQRDIIHLAVQAVAEGEVVVVPTESGYHAVGSGLQQQACSTMLRMVDAGAADKALVLPRTASEALDFAPEISVVASRFVSRGWPGPLELEIPFEGAGNLVEQLPDYARTIVVAEERFLRVRCVANDIVTEILRLSHGPLLAVPLVSEGKPLVEGGNSLNDCGAGFPRIAIDEGPTHHTQFATLVRVDGNCCQVIKRGDSEESALDEDQLRRLAQLVFLLVCTGNTCRSPMAAAMLEHKLLERFGEDAAHDFYVGSAGVSAFPGSPASPEAIAVMRARNLNLLSHQSNMVTGRSLAIADLVLAMTSSHRAAIVNQLPEYHSKVQLLSPENDDVSDPFGGSEATYAACADQIETYISQLVTQLDESWLPKWNFS